MKKKLKKKYSIDLNQFNVNYIDFKSWQKNCIILMYNKYNLNKF